MSKTKYNMPDGYSLVETAFRSIDFLRNPVSFVQNSMEKFGSTYTATLSFNKKLILTKDPEFINYILKENNRNYSKSEFATEKATQFFGQGLLFSNGDAWLKQRRLIQPAFHKEQLGNLFQSMILSIEEQLNNFPTGERVDICPPVNLISFNILINSIFDIKINPEILAELKSIFINIQQFLIKDINQPFRRIFYPLTGDESKSLRHASRLRTIVKDIISERKNSGRRSHDLLDMLLHSTYEDTGEWMSEEKIADELIVLIFAGHETTSNTLSWILYLLAQNQEIGNELSISLVGQSPIESMHNVLLQSVINESMRLYPAAWMTERMAINDDKFEDYSYPAGTIVIPFFYGLHRDKMHWENENVFQPQRFVEDGKIKRYKNFLPFGSGPRMCVGNNFAMAEITFFLNIFLKNYKITSSLNVPDMIPLITLRPDKVLIGLEKFELC